MSDQAQRLRELASFERHRRYSDNKTRAKRIAVTSGKGGVGKSSFSLNFACLAAQFGKKVLLIDADTNLANIDILLGLSPQYNISHVIAGLKSASDVLIKGPNGISILPAASGNFEQAMHEGLAAESVIADLNSLEEGFDYIVMDTGAGASRSVLDFVLFSDTMLLVTTPEPTAITDAYAVVKLITAERADIDIQILVNFAAGKQEAVDVFDKLASVIMHFLKIEVQYMGYLPRDMTVSESVHKQEPLVNAFPKSPAANQMKFIARKLMQLKKVPENDIHGMFSGIFRRFQLIK